MSFRQSPALLGDNGLLPVRNFLARLRRGGLLRPTHPAESDPAPRCTAPLTAVVRRGAGRARAENESSGYAQRGVTPRMLNEVPTLLWFADQGRIDPWLRGVRSQRRAVSHPVALLGFAVRV